MIKKTLWLDIVGPAEEAMVARLPRINALFWLKLVLSDQFYSCQFYVQTKCQTTNTVKVPVEVKSKVPYVQQQKKERQKNEYQTVQT